MTVFGTVFLVVSVFLSLAGLLKLGIPAQLLRFNQLNQVHFDSVHCGANDRSVTKATYIKINAKYKSFAPQ